VAYLPDTFRQAFANGAAGPRWWLKVGPQIATARFAWDHSKRDQIKSAFAVADGERGGWGPEFADLLQNPEQLRELARSMAASIYSQMPDKWVGTKMCPFNPDAYVVGNIAAITHTVEATGRVTTTAICAEHFAPEDPMALLPASARRLFLREVQP
jgi:hypothetical protein